MELFEYKDYNLTFAPQTLALKPFKKLWTRDRSKTKTRAIAELSYVYFFCDFKSDYSDILEEEDRRIEIVKSLTLPDGWVPDAVVKEACEFYKSRSETVATKLLENIIIGVNNIGEAFREVDINMVDERGKPIYNIAQMVGAAKNIPSLILALKEAEKEVKKESELKSSRKGSKGKGVFEDDI